MPLTQQSAVRLAIEQADVLVRPPFKFVIVPASEPHTLKLRVFDDASEIEKTRSVSYDFTATEPALGAVPVFKNKLRIALADLIWLLRADIAERWRKTS